MFPFSHSQSQFLFLSFSLPIISHSLEKQANSIAAAVYEVFAKGEAKTADMGGNATTSDFTKAVINKV